jgi:hypothetical protein
MLKRAPAANQQNREDCVGRTSATDPDRICLQLRRPFLSSFDRSRLDFLRQCFAGQMLSLAQGFCKLGQGR